MVEPDEAISPLLEAIAWCAGLREYLHSYITAFEKGEYVEKIIDHLDEAKYREDTEKFLGFWLYDVVARGGDPK